VAVLPQRIALVDTSQAWRGGSKILQFVLDSLHYENRLERGKFRPALWLFGVVSREHLRRPESRT